MTVSLPSFVSRILLTDYGTELTNWLVNAFNGEWLKIANAKPIGHFEKSQRPNPVLEAE